LKFGIKSGSPEYFNARAQQARVCRLIEARTCKLANDSLTREFGSEHHNFKQGRKETSEKIFCDRREERAIWPVKFAIGVN
jgi:hypothetical protein